MDINHQQISQEFHETMDFIIRIRGGLDLFERQVLDVMGTMSDNPYISAPILHDVALSVKHKICPAMMASMASLMETLERCKASLQIDNKQEASDILNQLIKEVNSHDQETNGSNSTGRVKEEGHQTKSRKRKNNNAGNVWLHNGND